MSNFSRTSSSTNSTSRWKWGTAEHLKTSIVGPNQGQIRRRKSSCRSSNEILRPQEIQTATIETCILYNRRKSNHKFSQASSVTQWRASLIKQWCKMDSRVKLSLFHRSVTSSCQAESKKGAARTKAPKYSVTSMIYLRLVTKWSMTSKWRSNLKTCRFLNENHQWAHNPIEILSISSKRGIQNNWRGKGRGRRLRYQWKTMQVSSRFESTKIFWEWWKQTSILSNIFNLCA